MEFDLNLYEKSFASRQDSHTLNIAADNIDVFHVSLNKFAKTTLFLLCKYSNTYCYCFMLTLKDRVRNRKRSSSFSPRRNDED